MTGRQFDPDSAARQVNQLLRSRDRRAWYPRDVDYRLIWEHLARQRDLDPRRFVRLDDGQIVQVGKDAAGEG